MIIISGASGGVGRFLIEELGGENEIIGTYHEHAPKELSDLAEFHEVDVTDSTSVERFVGDVAARLENVTLINLAGISLDGMAHKMPEDVWDRVVDTNLKGSFLMCRALLPFMRDQGYGRIINVSSVVGQTGVPGTIAYSSSKAGMFGMTRTIAAENATKGITANVLSLGYFSVGMIDVIKPDVQEVIRKSIPMKRLGDPKSIEHAVRFLMDCDYITGSVLNVNGGLI